MNPNKTQLVDYVLLCEDNFAKLRINILEYAKNGYIPHGSLKEETTTEVGWGERTWYSQVMIKYDNAEPVRQIL